MAVSAMKSSATIQLDNVTKRFSTRTNGDFTAVENVSLEVRPGEFVSVVGPSGCGKSTLCGLVSGLLLPTAGHIRLEGEEVSGISRKVGYLFQRDALLPWKTVLDNVTLPLLFRGAGASEAEAQARAWIGRVGLTGFERYHPHQLSGGMRKRVSLATTMVYEPDIILMDEPFSALDVQTRNLMENELLEIWAQDRKTILFITHDLEEAIALSDRVVVMTASPGRVKAGYEIPLGRPRSATEVRFDPGFGPLYEAIWKDLKDEVRISYEKSRHRL
jgi:NitT/TauT family transport system ATP-binding protein